MNKPSSPTVALESTVLTHGLPRPHNLQLARDMERAVREQGATPATIGYLDGQLRVGLSAVELTRLANAEHVLKVGPRDVATVIAKQLHGGTTVAGRLLQMDHNAAGYTLVLKDQAGKLTIEPCPFALAQVTGEVVQPMTVPVTDVPLRVQDALAQTNGLKFMLGTGCVVDIIAPHGNLMAARKAFNQ